MTGAHPASSVRAAGARARRSGAAPAVVAPAVVALALVAATAGCTSSGPTLDSLGAGALAGRNGAAYDGTCASLPLPDAAVGVSCLDGESASSSDVTLAAGDHAVVLLCDGAGSVSVRLDGRPADDAVEVPCARGEDPAVAHVLTVEEEGPARVVLSATGGSAKAVVLVPEA